MPRLRYLKPLPGGYCRCGCGQKTPLAFQTQRSLGHVKGLPVRYVVGHWSGTPEGRASSARNGRTRRRLRGPENPAWKGTLEERLRANLGPPDPQGCIPWLGAPDSHGYGRLFVAKGEQPVFAHRLAYLLWGSDVLRKGDLVHHVCRNPICCNPEHLLALSRAEHSRLHARLRRTERAAA